MTLADWLLLVIASSLKGAGVAVFLYLCLRR